MKHKVDELEGALLDVAVVMAQGDYLRHSIEGTTAWIERKSFQAPLSGQLLPFSPSSNWGLGGPIIEREPIAISWENGRPWAAVYAPGGVVRRTFAHTPLVAAMRAFVKSKLGEEVELP
jgi:hypothetical protein